MTLKLNTIAISLTFGFLLTSNDCTSQTKYSMISSDSVKILSFGIDAGRKQMVSSFGNPVNYKEYSDPYPPDGYGLNYYYDYDSLTAHYIEYYGKEVLGSIHVTSSRYTISTGTNNSFSINDSIDTFHHYKDSYEEYQISNKDKKSYEECYFIINLRFKDSIGLINVVFVNGIVTNIMISRDEDS